MQFVPPQRHAFAWGVITLVLGVVLWVLGPVLMPFVVAAVLAYALNPVVRGLERVGKPWIPSIVAVLLVEIGFLVMVVAVFTLLVPIVVTELPQMRDKLPSLRRQRQMCIRDSLTHWWQCGFGGDWQFGIDSCCAVLSVDRLAPRCAPYALVGANENASRFR